MIFIDWRLVWFEILVSACNDRRTVAVISDFNVRMLN